METYTTPVKDLLNNHAKISKTSSQSRDGDWVCMNCNNLNFSFRKKCNRCKTQTRQQNEATAAYTYYYYKPYSATQEELNSHRNQPNPYDHSQDSLSCTTFSEHSFHCDHLKTPIKDNRENLTPKKYKEPLPSVSPLLKKYNARGVLTTQQVSDQFMQSKKKGIFENQSLWNGISIRDFDQIVKAGSKINGDFMEEIENQDPSEELERLINKIIL